MRKKQIMSLVLGAAMVATMMAGCSSSGNNDKTTTAGTSAEDTAATTVEDTEEVATTEGETADSRFWTLADPEEVPEAKYHFTFDGDEEGIRAITQGTKTDEDLANPLLNGATYSIVDADAELLYSNGPVDGCLYLDGKYGVSLDIEPTGTDAYTVSFWINATRLASLGPTVTFGHNIGASDAEMGVAWVNVTQAEWGAEQAKIFPVLWNRNSESAVWPWIAAYDDEIHGKKEWVMVTMSVTGEPYNFVDENGVETPRVGTSMYLNGMLVSEGLTNEYGGFSPEIMRAVGDDELFEFNIGVNYWDTIFKGYVDDLYVFDTALTAGQVASLYALGDPTVETVEPAAEGGEAEAEPAPVEVNITGTAVGAVDFSTGFWSEFSDTWAVAAGESVTKTFVNYHGEEAANWNNFVVILQNVADAHSADANADYKEYAVVRADNFGWNAAGDTGSGVLPWTLESNWNWDTFGTDLNGATVVLTVTNNGETADVVADVTTLAGTTYQQKYTGIEVDGDLYFCLTVDSSCVDIQN
ncbi:MAG: hypothetical protein ACI4C1_01345 [Lachnospiraceae bacterium]